ncbi:MAG: hypothetical protein KIS76_14240 [Pyrinomonadaceae bacterium]|nr:hypothetical protein [Pyrinomonadaceae bacterium]
MEQFEKIGEQIETAWRDQNYAEDKFPDIAAEALSHAGLPEKITAWEVVEWTLAQTQLPDQRDLRGNFGDPPITLFNAPRFHIDVYFWLQGTTAIHQHAFCGAFQVLHGSSIHSWYEFSVDEKVNSFVELGKMSLKSCDLLEVGDIQKILAGRQYIHGLFHLDQPSATIVVRTHKSPLYLPQFSYHKPSLAIDPFFEDPNLIKKLQCISALYRSNHEKADEFAARLLEVSDFQSSYSILSNTRGFLKNEQINRVFDIKPSNERFDAMVEIVRRRHGARAEVLPAVFAHNDMVAEIVDRRGFITDPELRFFLALLMNIDGREKILELISSRFPENDPVEKVLDWVFELSQVRVMGSSVPNALGIADFGALDLFVLECRLRAFSDKDAAAEFQKQFPGEDPAKFAERIADKGAQLNDCVVLRPLFL